MKLKMKKSHEHYSKTLGELTASKCKAKAAFTKIKHELIRQLKQTSPNHREIQTIISRLNECQGHAITLMLRLASEYKDSDYKQCWRNTVRETEIMKREFEEARKMAQTYLEKYGGSSCSMAPYGERRGSIKEKCIELVRDDDDSSDFGNVEKEECGTRSNQEQSVYDRTSEKWDFSFQETGESEKWMAGSGWMDSDADPFTYKENITEKRAKDARRNISDSSLVAKQGSRRVKEREAACSVEKEKTKQEKMKKERRVSEERIRRLSEERMTRVSDESRERLRRVSNEMRRAVSEERLRRAGSVERSLNTDRNEIEEHRLKNMQRKTDPAYVTHTLEKMMKSKRAHEEHAHAQAQVHKENLKGCRKESKIPVKTNTSKSSVIRRHVSFGGFDATEKTRPVKTKQKQSNSSKQDCSTESLISIIESRKSFINYNKLRVKLLDILDYPKPRRKTVKDVQDMMKAYYKRLCDDILILSEEYKHDIRRKEVEMMDAYNMAQMFLDSCAEDQESESGMSLGDFSLKDLPHKINNSQRKPQQCPSDDEFLINVNVRL